MSARETGTSTRHRLQLEITSLEFARLERIRESADIHTNVGAIRNALLVYEWLLDQKDAGNQIQVCDKEGVVRGVTILI